MKNRIQWVMCGLVLLLSLFWCKVLFASDQLYFTGLCIRNPSDGTMTALLEWGSLEGSLDDKGITSFNIYRRSQGGQYQLVATVDNVLSTAEEIRSFFEESGEDIPRAEIIAWLQDTHPEKSPNGSNYFNIVHDILTPGGADYNSLQAGLLVRLNRDVARAEGRAWMDKNIGSGPYTYMITVVQNGSETGPVGRINLDTSSPTVLPAPEDFRQVLVAGCSDLRQRLDHGRVHLTWTVPGSPDVMPLRILVYGYDIFRHYLPDGPNGTCPSVDLRNGVPAGFTKVNDVPVIPSGNPAGEGPGSYLAIDEGKDLPEGKLRPGDTYCYYLAARDLAGNYSETQGPIKVVIPDLQGPVMPWNVHAGQEMVWNQGQNASVPIMSLTWDEVNSNNYLQSYGNDRKICKSSPQEICYVEEDEECGAEVPFCVDLDVYKYLVFRFDSFEEASKWGGADSDSDLWPDEVERAEGTDPCDPASHPAGVLCNQASNPPCDPAKYYPTEVISQILQDDPGHVITLDSGKRIIRLLDSGPQPNNQVHWYRVAAVDPSGNLSSMTPPARAVLWDRSQPDVINASLEINSCDMAVVYEPDTHHCTKAEEPGVLSFVDETGQAYRVAMYESCVDATSGMPYLKEVLSGQLSDGMLEVDNQAVQDILYGYCHPQSDPCGPYIVHFYDREGELLASSQLSLNLGQICGPTHMGCVFLRRDCSYVQVDGVSVGAGAVHFPSQPVRVCVDLPAPDTSARIYQEINGKMSPIDTLRTSSAGTVCGQESISSIVAAPICLGVKVFNQNSVGSPMYYLPCFTVALDKGLPATPLIESIVQNTDAANPKFTVTWGGQKEGISAFILQGQADFAPTMDTIWDPLPIDGENTFQRDFPIAPEDIGKKWCFKVKALDLALDESGWSQEQCAVWKQAPSEVWLKWPQMPTLSEGEDISVFQPALPGVTITAFVISSMKIPALIISRDLAPYFGGLLQEPYQCEHCVSNCYGANPCSKCSQVSTWSSSFFQCDICGMVRSWNRIGDFVVYRQEEGKDFVQVSPLVDDIFCQGPGWTYVEDPMVGIATFQSDGSSHAVTGGTDPASEARLQAGIEGTGRMVFLDYYPVAGGSRVRYKLVSFDRGSREPQRVYTSNWVLIPQP